VAIRNWHWGKLVILWAWGGVIAALLLTDFLSTPVQASPLVHLLELIGFVLILLILSCVTWRWLSGRESVDRPENPSKGR
jgi:cytochrome b561